MTHTEIIEKVKESITPDLPIDQAAIDGLEEGLLKTIEFFKKKVTPASAGR